MKDNLFGWNGFIGGWLDLLNELVMAAALYRGKNNSINSLIIP